MHDDLIPYGLCQCGCGRETNVKPHNNRRLGMVKGEPYDFVCGHHRPSKSKRRRSQKPRAKKPADLTRFRVDEASGCWVWQGSMTEKGYGLSRGHRAHRVMYEHLVAPIPAGLQIDHLCRNRACVNPDHLEPVTPAVNQQRVWANRGAASPHRGVTWEADKGKWRARIRLNKASHHLGLFDSEREAARAAVEFIRATMPRASIDPQTLKFIDA